MGAIIDFTGVRVVEQNAGDKMPLGFQTTEFQREGVLILF